MCDDCGKSGVLFASNGDNVCRACLHDRSIDAQAERQEAEVRRAAMRGEGEYPPDADTWEEKQMDAA